MKFINAIQKGDFVKLRTASKIKIKFNGEDVVPCPIIGGRAIKFPDGNMLVIEPNLRRELGNVVRVKCVSDDKQRERIYFNAENNGIKYPDGDGDDLFFDDRSVEAVMINGVWYDADSKIYF